MNGGWIKLHRRFLHHGYLAMPGTALRIWLYLLLAAKFAPVAGLAPGDVETSYTAMQEACSEEGGPRLARTSIARALDYLENRRMIERNPGRPGRALRITISNWRKYQEEDTSSETLPGSATLPGSETQPATSSMMLPPPLLVDPGNPLLEPAAGHDKKDKNAEVEEAGCAGDVAKLHQAYMRLLGKFPSGRDDALMNAAVQDARTVSADPVGLVVEAMERAHREYKPTALSPQPRDFRYFIGWIERAIQDARAAKEGPKRERAHEARRDLRRAEPAGAAGAAADPWVRAEHLEE